MAKKKKSVSFSFLFLTKDNFIPKFKKKGL